VVDVLPRLVLLLSDITRMETTFMKVSEGEDSHPLERSSRIGTSA